jgi:hypothetical protein
LIKEECTWELLRFTIRHILNQLHNDQIYPYLEQEQQEQQKKAQNNQQQQLVNPVNLRPTTIGHPHHAPKLYQTSNLQTPKITSSAISLLPTKTNVPYDISNLSNEYLETKALKSVHRHYVKENNHKAITNTRRRL